MSSVGAYCQCGCPRYQCCCHKSADSILEQAKEAGIDITSFELVGMIEFYMKKACELYEYLMVTQPIEYNDSQAKNKYQELLAYKERIATSMIGRSTYDSNESARTLITAYDIYMNKCAQLIVLRNDPVMKNRVFPMTSYEVPDTMVSFVGNRF